MQDFLDELESELQGKPSTQPIQQKQPVKEELQQPKPEIQTSPTHRSREHTQKREHTQNKKPETGRIQTQTYSNS